MTTGLLEIFYVVLRVLIWAGMLFAAVRIGRYMRADFRPGEPISHLFWRQRFLLLMFTLAFVIVVMISNMETAYRPKIMVDPLNPMLEEKLKQVDEAKPKVDPSKLDQPSWEERQKKTREENEKVKKEFESLPSAQPTKH